MFETLKPAVTKWHQARSDREKLQHTYVVLIIAVIFLTGIVSLFSNERSEQLLFVAVALLTALVVNFVTWSLLKTTVLDKLPTRRSSSRR